MSECLLVAHKHHTPEEDQILAAYCQAHDIELHCVKTPDEAKKYIAEATIMHSDFSKLIPLAPKLKWFSSISAGVNSYLPYLKEETILTNSSGTFGVSIAEHLVMVILNMLRAMPTYHESVQARSWRRDFPCDTVVGKRITVLGTGDIGQSFAKRIRPFEPACIIGVSYTGRKKDYFDVCHGWEELDRILPETDILVMCVPETKLTVNIMNRQRIFALPKGARLINVGRGSALDEEALMEALNNGHLASAALDVFRKEPLPQDSPLYETPNLLITPHCSGMLVMEYNRRKNVSMFYENLQRYVNGQPLLHVVDKKREY